VGHGLILILGYVGRGNRGGQRLGLAGGETGGGIGHLGEFVGMGVVTFPLLGPEGAPEFLAFAGLALQAGVLLAKFCGLGLCLGAGLLELDDDGLEVGNWDGGIGVIRGGLGWIRSARADLPASSRVAM
jgi:hypothetical protein